MKRGERDLCRIMSGLSLLRQLTTIDDEMNEMDDVLVGRETIDLSVDIIIMAILRLDRVAREKYDR